MLKVNVQPINYKLCSIIHWALVCVRYRGCKKDSDLLKRLVQISVTIAGTEELLTAFPVPQKTGS